MTKDAKRITVLLSSLRTGGAERAMLMFCSELLERGFAVELVLCREEGQLQELAPPNLPIVNLGCNRTIHAIPKLARYLASKRPDALYTTVRNINIAALCATKLSGIDLPVIVRESSAPLSCPKKTHLDTLAYRLMPITYRFARGIIAVSDGVAEELISMSRVFQERVAVIPNPVISSEMLAQAEHPIDHRWFSQPELRVIVCAARVERYKGHKTLVTALAHLREKIDAKLVILGSGTYQGEVKQRVSELQLSEHVDFRGFVANPFPYMKRAHACVLASEHEGLPNVLIQAMAFGTPVVSTDCKTGPAEILCNGRYGYLVPVGDAKALADALEQAILLPRQEESKAYAHRRYSVQRATSEYLALAGLDPTTASAQQTDPTPASSRFLQSDSPSQQKAH